MTLGLPRRVSGLSYAIVVFVDLLVGIIDIPDPKDEGYDIWEEEEPTRYSNYNSENEYHDSICYLSCIHMSRAGDKECKEYADTCALLRRICVGISVIRSVAGRCIVGRPSGPVGRCAA